MTARIFSYSHATRDKKIADKKIEKARSVALQLTVVSGKGSINRTRMTRIIADKT